jgi:BirA family transcriptional regulator, biotin operon repressor / biotin---[acetyl-CoA-carboxylase] ligase
MLRPNKDIIKKESVSSTNDFAKELLLKTIPIADITVIDAKEQTKGRGQRGNSWESETGKNAILSFIVKPTFLKPNQQFYLSMAVSLAIVECVNEFCDSVFIKWPNDIYISNKKLCGILIENSLLDNSIQTAIIGIGLNVNQTNFSDWIPNPTSLKLETGNEFDIDTIKGKLIEHFEKYFDLLQNRDFEYIHINYLKHLYLKDKKSFYKDEIGIFEGKIISVNVQGYIKIEKKNAEIKQYSFKEVEYLLHKN